MSSFFRKLTWLAGRHQKESDLQDELRFHLEEEADEQIASGRSTPEARLAARRDLGNLALVQEDTRAAWSWTFVEQFAQDVRYAFRTIAGNRSFSALAILSLALGIGANTAIFSFMDSIMLRSLPVDHPESLVILSFRTHEPEVSGFNMHEDSFLGPHDGFADSVCSYPAFEMFRKNERIFSDVFGYQGAGDLHFVSGDRADLAKTEYVTGNYFHALGVPPAAGRLIMPDDDRAGASAVAVISYAFSQRRFAGAENAVGKPVFLNQHPFTVIGVAPPRFFGADPAVVPDVYIPMHAVLDVETNFFPNSAVNFADPNYEWVVPMARLRPGVGIAQAQAVLAPQLDQWMRTINTNRRRDDLPRLVIRNGGAGLNQLRFEYSKPLVILLILVALILAIACANIANLLLARATARRREIAIRLGIGAGRWRLVRQLLTESVILASVGGFSGILFAVWGIGVLTNLIGKGQENFALHADLNWHVLLVVAGLSILTGTLFGLAPALQATRVDLLSALKESRTSTGRAYGFRRFTLSRLLIVVQIAISLVILVAAGLFVRSLNKLESIDLGFHRENILTFNLNAVQAGHNESEAAEFYSRLRARLAAIPGVRSASLSNYTLVSGRSMTMTSVRGDQPKGTLVMSVGPDFFTTIQTPILLGRALESRDMGSSHQVAVVNQKFASRRFAGKDPLGEFVEFAAFKDLRFEIVGVCGDALVGHGVRDKGGPTVFLPFTADHGEPLRAVYYELRTAGNPLAYVSTVRDLVREADPRLPVSEVQTQSAIIDGTINREVIFARLCTGFALLALAISCVGLYGVMSYNVARRIAEIGIRVALGARRASVVWMVLREVLLLAAIGLSISIPAALFASKVLKSFLYDVEPRDPVSIVVAAVSLVTVTILAGYLPARFASGTDPMSALRHE